MYKMCEKCGFMYDDSCGACPQCNNSTANSTDSQKNVNTGASHSFSEFRPATSTVSGGSSRRNNRGSGGIPKPVIAVLVVGLVGVIIAVGAIVAVRFLGGNQLPVGNNSVSENIEDSSNSLLNDFQGSGSILNAGNISDAGASEIFVYFDSGNGDPINQITMTPGYIQEPATPVRDGYVFDGWYDEASAKKWDFANNVANESITLFARWVEESGENEKLVLAVDGLRLRETPDLSGKKIGLIPNGTHVIVEDTVDGWSYTTYKGQSGWCSSEFLYNPADYEGEVLFKAYVDNKNGLTLYVNEHTDSTIINDNISYKSTVYVYEVDDEWSYVRYGDEYGWCLSEELDDYR